MRDEVQSSGDSPAFDRSQLAEDARTLVERVEAVHPDPYVGYESRVALHARLERVVRDLPETATAEAFYRRAAPLVAGLEDTHSRLHPPSDGALAETGEDRRLPVWFRVVGDRLSVEAVSAESGSDLVGARLLAVEGEPVDNLVERTAAFFGDENRYGALARTGEAIRDPATLARSLGRSDPPEDVTVRVTRDGEEQSVSLAPNAHGCERTHELERSFPHPSGIGPRYRLYEDGDAAVFVPGDLKGYRECLEVLLDRDGDLAEDLAPAAYDRHVGGDRPDEVAEMVAAVPSMAATLGDVCDETAAAETETLIVDLRDNPGGDSQFVFHLAYVLQGWDGVARVLAETRSLTRRTEAHRERYGVPDDADERPGTATANSADYDFSEFLDEAGDDVEDSLDRHRRLLTRQRTFGDFVEEESYEGALEVDSVVVVVSAETKSSAFAGAAQLAGLGADVVGVPPGQAPLSFGEPVEERLPNTGLTVQLAGSMYHWVSEPDATVLEPDRELTPALFRRYDAARDAGLRLAFEHADVGETAERPPEPVDI